MEGRTRLPVDAPGAAGYMALGPGGGCGAGPCQLQPPSAWQPHIRRGCWGKSSGNEAKIASPGAGWGWDGSHRAQRAHCKPQSEVTTEGSLAHGIGWHNVPLWRMPHGCSTGAFRVAPALLGPPGALLVHARACLCWDSGRVAMFSGASTGTSTGTGLLPVCPAGCEQTAPLPPAGHRQPLTGGTPCPVFLHHLAACAEPVNHTAGGKGSCRGLGVLLGLGARGAALSVPTAMGTCPPPLIVHQSMQWASWQ